MDPENHPVGEHVPLQPRWFWESIWSSAGGYLSFDWFLLALGDLYVGKAETVLQFQPEAFSIETQKISESTFDLHAFLGGSFRY